MASASNAYKHDKALQAAHQQQLKALLRAPGNESCADCGGRFPRFASVSLGVFLCNRCYGIHRGIGVHVTRTKCVELDAWSHREVAAMRAMGNRRAAAIWQGETREGETGEGETGEGETGEGERWEGERLAASGSEGTHVSLIGCRSGAVDSRQVRAPPFHNPAAAAAAAAASATAASPATASPPSTTPSTPCPAFPHGPADSTPHCSPACPPQPTSTPPPTVVVPPSAVSASSTGGMAHARQGVDALSSARLMHPPPATTAGRAAHHEQHTLTAAGVPAGQTGHAAAVGSGSSSIGNVLSVSGAGSSSSMDLGPSYVLLFRLPCGARTPPALSPPPPRAPPAMGNCFSTPPPAPASPSGSGRVSPAQVPGARRGIAVQLPGAPPPIPAATGGYPLRKSLAPGVVSQYNYQEVQAATQSFSTEIGRGGFGVVFHGRLADPQGGPAHEVAVKLMAEDHITNGIDSFITEVGVARVHHPNILRLEGYVVGATPILIYDYVSMGDASTYLAKAAWGEVAFTWKQRVAVALGCAEALTTIHANNFVHRDFKATNVLLRQDLTPVVADFGLARAMGSVGYIDPIYFDSGMLSRKSDTYAFGIFLLELVSGCSALDARFKDLRKLVTAKDFPDPTLVVDPQLQDQWQLKQVLLAFTLIKFAIFFDWEHRPGMDVLRDKLKNLINDM
ncbi:unnamed protein product [Closterium sp. NIES-64]|nr:unnamed protein product [Closterium sp. NIES-64]